MTITPEMLSEEAGFVEGVVVEYRTEYSSGVFYYSQPLDGDIALYCGSHGYIQFDNMILIKPLTGPLAHWSLDCVPDDAEWSSVSEMGVDFFTEEVWEELSGEPIRWHSCKVSRRPWWCGRKNG